MQYFTLCHLTDDPDRKEEFVVKEGASYRVGIQFLEYGAYARSEMDIYGIAKPEIDRLAESTGELANLMIEEHG